MSNRARAIARGRARGRDTGAGQACAPAPSVGAQPEAAGELVGRGRGLGGATPFAGAGRGRALQEFSLRVQQVKPENQGGCRGDVFDLGINTRGAMEHVRDSKTGRSGDAIALTANFFRMVSRPDWIIYQYHVDFNPQMDSRRLRHALLCQHQELLGSTLIFDGRMLFLPHRLHQKETKVLSSTRDGENVNVTITLTNELPPSSPACVHLFNILFKRIMRIMDMHRIGRNYYNPGDPLNVPQHKLTIWPGFASNILQYESGLMLCTDVSHKVLRSETVLDFMVNLRQQFGAQRFSDVCAKELIGLIVLTKYNNKTYRVDDIAWDQNPKNTFKKGDKDVSFLSYYKTQYSLDITDGNQVLLVSHVKKKAPAGTPPPGPALLVPELCYLTGLTDKMRNDFGVMKALHDHTRLNPQQREGRLNQFISKIQDNTDAQRELHQWGMRFDNKLIKLTGRVLPREKILQGARSYEFNPKTADWVRESRGLALTKAPPLKKWVLFYTSRNCTEAQALVRSLHQVSGPLGIAIQNPTIVDYQDQTDQLLRALKQNVGPETQMVVVVLPSNRKDKYDQVKKYLCVEFPIPSQCVLARTLSRPQVLVSVATKIALQMTCKMGGELWSVEIPLRRLMVVGIDCYHDLTAGRRSVGAVVASLNQGMSRWFSRCVPQHKGQEIMDGLKSALSAALGEYHRYNNCLPERVIVYRDGVGDGQLHGVVNYEVKQIIDSMKSMQGDCLPLLSVVVVKKRISSRFFALLGSRVSNPPPGTVIDTEVTRPEWYDFYIVSQAVSTGSVSPTHYNVVYDTSGLKPDHMQRLTYKLCHMYFNFQGTIRVPAPCQYAHKLAFLVGQSLHKEPHVQLDDLLYYL